MAHQSLSEKIITFFFCAITIGITYVVAQGMAVPQDPVRRAHQIVASAPPERLMYPLFSPDDNIKEVLLGLIRQTTGRIVLAIYMFTDPDLAQALIERHRAGVPVEIIADHNCALTEWSKIPLMRRAGIPIHVFPAKSQPSRRDLLMHNKFLVCFNCCGRKAITVTGSFNFTRSANGSNHENMLVIDSSIIAQKYFTRFGQIKLHTKPFAVSGRPSYARPHKTPDRLDIGTLVEAIERYVILTEQQAVPGL